MAISPENRKKFEKYGLDMIRLDYVEGGRRLIGPPNRSEAQEWIAEKVARDEHRETSRYRAMLFLTVVAAIAAVIAAVPVVQAWISN
jgi:hypothetical protein